MQAQLAQSLLGALLRYPALVVFRAALEEEADLATPEALVFSEGVAISTLFQ
jgi:hypothetical protein